MEKWSTSEQQSVASLPTFDFLEEVPAARHPVALPLLLPGTVVTMQTRNTRYRFVVVDGPARQISISGGRLFPQSTDVQLLGAREGEDGVKAGWIVEGLPLQLITPDGPVLTSVVEAVDVDIDPESLTEAPTQEIYP
jgi:hypothetical protein